MFDNDSKIGVPKAKAPTPQLGKKPVETKKSEKVVKPTKKENK